VETKGGGENNNPNNKQQQNDEKSNIGTGIAEVHDCLFDNFWVAYDALDLKQNNMPLLM